MPQLTAEAWTAWGGALAVAVALLQLALHRRLDLGGLTLATGTVLWIASEGGEALAGWLCAAALVAGLAWWRGVRRGVGRPELTGAVGVVSVLALLAPLWVVPLLPAVQPDQVAGAGAGVVALAGAVSVLLATERRGLVGQRTYHWREVPIDGPTGRSGEGA
ncbi:MAG: hypothetical protein H6732_09135 [Alphaproteobacteria bacterium]|nr:hypothetical protein [Alphaproteobacteria bacterium]